MKVASLDTVTRVLTDSLLNSDRSSTVARALALAGEGCRLAAGESVLDEGDPPEHLLVLLEGSVKVFYRSSSEIELVAKVFAAPAVFGEMECIAKIPHLESVACLEPVALWKIPAAVFLSHLETSATLAAGMARDLAERLCIAAQHERSLAFDPVPTRLANMLCTYLDLFALPTPTGERIRIPLSQEELAQSIGVARKSVARALRGWQDEGLVVKEGRHFVISDPAALRALCTAGSLSIAHSAGTGLRRVG
ncbi:MAG: Crp/Fnr family transcriptional regulator [Myxococcota bacterium]